MKKNKEVRVLDIRNTDVFDDIVPEKVDDLIGSNEKENGQLIFGYAAVFNRSTEIYGFMEAVAPEAFSELDTSNTVALFNHDYNMPLGRVSNGSLRMIADDFGYLYDLDLPDTSLGNDIYKLVKRRDLIGSSFSFTVASETWDFEGDMPMRIINKVEHLYDVGPVTVPAYADTTVALRKMEEARKARPKVYTGLSVVQAKLFVDTLLNI